MQQSSSGVLVSLVLIVGLALAFALGIRYLGSGLASSALSAPTATVRPADVVGPNISGSSGQSGGRGGTHSGGTSNKQQPTPTVTPAPQPTPVPTSAAKVVMAKSLGPGETAAEPATSFPASSYKIYCVATFPKAGPGDVITFRYLSRDSNTEVWHSDPSNITRIPAPSTDVSRATYLLGPFSAGKYVCDVLLNGKPAGSASYTMQ